MGTTITHCGPVGHGQLTKLGNQILVSVNLLAVCEAIAFARCNDLDPDVMITAIQGGRPAAGSCRTWDRRSFPRTSTPGFMVDLIQKDLRLVMGSAQGKTALPACSLVHQLLNTLQAMGGGREGTQALARVVERLGG